MPVRYGARIRFRLIGMLATPSLRRRTVAAARGLAVSSCTRSERRPLPPTRCERYAAGLEPR